MSEYLTRMTMKNKEKDAVEALLMLNKTTKKHNTRHANSCNNIVRRSSRISNQLYRNK